ncbi:MAG: DNA mismatch repair endonuclease MutH [Proteobacteria bacterium]|nr:DNA mismatch repair endonuclease MutH [Pseudomonadota bacterium]
MKFTMFTKPPTSEIELLTRAKAIAGMTFQQLAHAVGENAPINLLREKGWLGQLIEIHLGASAGSKPEPDFQSLGIELKTLPVNQNGLPKESTFVCSVSLLTLSETIWETSLVRRKLSRVLWIPIEADPNIPIPERRIGSAILWSPSLEQELILKEDWQELTDMMSLGQLEKITARLGTYLQIRPKAAHGKSLSWGIDEQGEKILTLPRGFYLRASFTRQVLSA